jgi:MATE family multidrug resistance protein
VLFVWPATLIAAFTTDPRIVQIGVGLLAIAAAFQLFDGTQAVATGVLRGIGETRMPMIVNVIGHWVLGLPVGYALCFRFGWGVVGLWVGLSIGLVVTGVVLVAVWWRRAAVMQNSECRMQK